MLLWSGKIEPVSSQANEMERKLLEFWNSMKPNVDRDGAVAVGQQGGDKASRILANLEPPAS